MRVAVRAVGGATGVQLSAATHAELCAKAATRGVLAAPAAIVFSAAGDVVCPEEYADCVEKDDLLYVSADPDAVFAPPPAASAAGTILALPAGASPPDGLYILEHRSDGSIALSPARSDRSPGRSDRSPGRLNRSSLSPSPYGRWRHSAARSPRSPRSATSSAGSSPSLSAQVDRLMRLRQRIRDNNSQRSPLETPPPARSPSLQLSPTPTPRRLPLVTPPSSRRPKKHATNSDAWIGEQGALQAMKENLESGDVVLDLQMYNIAAVPASIVDHVHVETLLLDDNYNLAELPASLAKLPKLRELSLGGTPLLFDGGVTAPPVLAELTNLEILVLSDNELVLVPDVVGTLTGLKALSLQANRLTAMPRKVLAKLEALEELNLQGNRIRGDD